LILVTGGAGFIGSALVARIVREGGRVRVLDDFSTGTRERLRRFPEVEVREGDVACEETVRAALRGVTGVAHLAALASVPRAEFEPALAVRSNVLGTLTVLVEARRAGVSGLVYASSCSVYGDYGEGPIPENAPLVPQSVYAATKLAGERHVLLHHRTGGPPAVALRFFNVYGPGQPADCSYAGVLARFARVAELGERPEVHGDGGQTRDFVFVADVVEAILLALRHAGSGAGGGVFNVGTGAPSSVLEIWKNVAESCGSDQKPVFGPLRPGDVRHAAADVRSARESLGFEARVSLDEGVRRLTSPRACPGS